MKHLTLIAASILFASNAMAANTAPLTLDVYNADKNSFHVNSTLVIGESEVMVVDTGFTKADALRIAAKVLDSGKTLKTIFISQADPDYYFGAEVLHTLFPEAKILTTAAVKAVIEEKLAGKLAFWTPKMGENAPVKPYIPTVVEGNTLFVDGHKIEIHGTQSELAHRPYLWIPSSKAILGNVAVYGNVHLWMADAQSQRSQQAWSRQLKELKALKPEIVIPGHMKAGTKLDSSTISYSQQYLSDFSQAKSSSKNSAELIDSMSARYPDAGLPMALGIGAKVHMGEMKW
ncbi:MBL fold metallo-hydrolase [Pseudoalteromonas piscicida]|uniref:MBL fold metallo-hydrolase n=1 Tax=Pseudoalteromonas TaxID=53246 RepID=UPI001573E389|nr:MULTISPECIES: MBL fold metallo-hydrolase [Pseudoalteromonas]NSY34624.1 MBL fold metallo-hydrolase [Pseudoalteromonas sp. JC28]QUI71421.1 MBL fold metallo-hydrolase [Pseudoalteromonas sp. M8]UDM61252.1 MBL fold metallo-hydrolase [Pseudoalteromonas piscicida]